MPELPEVETMCRGIAPCLGTTIRTIERPRCHLKPIQIRPLIGTLRKKLCGAQIQSIERLGKRVVLCTDRNTFLVFEPRMTGLLLLADPPNAEHLRLRIGVTKSGRRGQRMDLLFWDRRGLGTVQLLNSSAYDALRHGGKLGPDALQMTPSLYRQQLGQSRQAIKVALLDQKRLAGIGNLYAAEILLLAGIHPGQKCIHLTDQDWRNLSSATRRVLRQAIRYEGSTLSDGTYRNALNKKGRYQNHHRVYGREGKTCRRCRVGQVQRIVQCQRATFYCPYCQEA